ncbi:hypothetical protein Pan161_41640 [Gimesia algae]|uniref:Uncharacterized protein n=1 Tax=Gimesia algae TaxID=2527971 RepID=A0A517VHP4_9PLAN|nr:hypothetical protein Pan161_41640 [Gimesia algae]
MVNCDVLESATGDTILNTRIRSSRGQRKGNNTRPDLSRAWLSSVDLTEMMKQDQGTWTTSPPMGVHSACH